MKRAKEPLENILDACAAFFDLGQVQYTLLAGGYSNQNFFIRTERGEFLVKLMCNPRAHILREIAYLERLRQYAFPVSLYLRAPSGAYYWEDAQSGKRVVVQKRIAGQPPEQSAEMCRVIGAHLARLHTLPADNLPVTRSNLDQTYVQQSMAIVQATFDAEMLRPLLAANERLADFPWEQLPHSITHGDLTRHNCLFYRGDLTALVDWEEVGVNVALLDLAVCLLSCCYRYHGEMGIELVPAWYDSLLLAYRHVRTLSALEERWLGAALWQAAVIISLWGLLQFGIYTPDAGLLRDWLHPLLASSAQGPE
jgi:Ser/Thr protein kinase RdoA (MazF antagonist)